VRRWHRLAVASAAGLRSLRADDKGPRGPAYPVAREARAHPHNGLLAVLLAHIHLERGDLPAAAAALHGARPDDPFEQRLCLCLADLLAGRVPPPGSLPEPPPGAPPQVTQACHLLAALAGASGPGPGSHAELLRLLAEGLLAPPPDDLADALDNPPFRPGLGRPPLEVRDVLFG
jgi:hypothetical protein